MVAVQSQGSTIEGFAAANIAAVPFNPQPIAMMVARYSRLANGERPLVERFEAWAAERQCSATMLCCDPRAARAFRVDHHEYQLVEMNHVRLR